MKINKTYSEKWRQAMSEKMTLLILPTKQVLDQKLLDKVDWVYVGSISDITHEDDIKEELEQIGEFFGKEYDVKRKGN